MPAANRSPRSRRAPTDRARIHVHVLARALIVIDNEPLQREAWAEFHTVRKRLEKATRDLHRYEEVDRPAYDSWVYQTFPTLISSLRELQAEVYAKGQKVQMVQALAEITGRPLKKLWKEQKEREEHPEKFKKNGGEDSEESASDDRDKIDDGEESDAQRARRRANEDEWDSPAPPPPTSREAKDIYRRLVQLLHPDRGGEWTAAREQVWHEVQRAWEARDTDWLARLEVEWESSHDVLTAQSPVGRLRRAIAELHRARRDAERKLREYRNSFPWRFTQSEKNRQTLYRRMTETFENDLEFLQRQLAYLDATIAAWEGRGPQRPRGLSRSRRFAEEEEDESDF
jgi:hypothetical protein